MNIPASIGSLPFILSHTNNYFLVLKVLVHPGKTKTVKGQHRSVRIAVKPCGALAPLPLKHVRSALVAEPLGLTHVRRKKLYTRDRY